HFVIEVDHKRTVLVFAQNVFEKAVAGGALLAQHAPLAQARIHQEAERQRQIGLPRKVGDGLRVPILLEGKVLFGKIGDDVPVLIAHRRKDVDYVHAGREGRVRRLLLVRRVLRGNLLRHQQLRRRKGRQQGEQAASGNLVLHTSGKHEGCSGRKTGYTPDRIISKL